MQRAQQYALVQVPDQLESPATRYERAYLLRGHLVCRYSNSGTLVVVHAAQRAAPQTVCNSSPIVCMGFAGAVVATLHASDALQLYNVETRAVDQYQLERDSLAGVRVLVADARHIVALAPRRALVWERERLQVAPLPRALDTGPGACAAPIACPGDRSALLGDGRLVLANANPGGHLFQLWDLASGALLAYAEAPSRIDSALTLDVHRSGLVVASFRDTMHLWSLPPAAAAAAAAAPAGSAGSAAAATATAAAAAAPGDAAAAAAAGEAQALQGSAVTFENRIVTAVHVDAHFVLTGDNWGNVSLHTRGGRLVYHLTRDRRAPSDVDMREVDLTRLSALFKARVNRLARVGRWVVAALENSRIELYDIFTPSLATPCDSYAHPTAAPVRDMALLDQRVYALLAPAAAAPSGPSSSSAASSSSASPFASLAASASLALGASAAQAGAQGLAGGAAAQGSQGLQGGGAAGAAGRHKPELVVWASRTEAQESFEAAAGEAQQWGVGVVELLQQACSRTVVMVKKLEGLRPEDVRHHMATLNGVMGYLDRLADLEAAQGLSLPFLLYQHLQQALDAFETYALKLAKGVRTAKSREHLDDLRSSLVRSMDLLLCCADFLGDVKAKTSTTGSLIPYSEKGSSAKIEGEGGADGHASFFHVKRKNLRKALDAKRGSGSGSGAGAGAAAGGGDEDDDMVDEMLQDVVEDLGAMHEQTNDVIERFDTVCNEGIHDPDKVMPLLSIYTKLRQLSEDMKETGKEVGELRGDDPTGEWWEGGGDYDDSEASAAAAAAAAASSSALQQQQQQQQQAPASPSGAGSGTASPL
eukprot:m51a1_g10760 hypothetical protein (819) ;mRNA; f:7714-10469